MDDPGALGFALSSEGGAGAGSARRTATVHGITVETDEQVRLLTGPVIGEVTSGDAVVLLEVDRELHASSSSSGGLQRSGSAGGGFGFAYPAPFKGKIGVRGALYRDFDLANPVQILERSAKPRRPFTFHFRGLEPSCSYVMALSGVCERDSARRMATFRTKAAHPDRFRMFVLSCDRPSRLLLGQQDPWQQMLRRCGEVDLVVHAGDQIYPDNEDIPHAAEYFERLHESMLGDDEMRRSMVLRGRELYRNKYRAVFTRGAKAELMARVSNLMIWSDNDVANDFTTMRNADGGQKYHPTFLQCGMRTYREYQRRLWDPRCPLDYPVSASPSSAAAAGEVREWHQHHYGPVGVFLFDLRGNRVDSAGVASADAPLISDAQWADFDAFLARPGLRAAVLCSETPFLGDEPGECQAKVHADPNMDFLKDHWPYNEAELVRLLDTCFAWKAQGEQSGEPREILLVGGDIHCGVTSVVRDDSTGLQIDQLTASPVTNHVCKFFPPLQGTISGRYNFSHLPLGSKFRNYADVSISVEQGGGVSIQARLVPVSTDIFKEDESWRTEFDDDEEEDNDGEQRVVLGGGGEVPGIAGGGVMPPAGNFTYPQAGGEGAVPYPSYN